VPLLGALPLDIRIREQTDGGKPTVVADPDGPLGAIYRDVARRMGLELLRRNASQGQVPSITVTND
jgi:ATP-binding protein involved in chromosome partitioning